VRILFLVLLLILNVYAEAKGSGAARSSSKTKKAKSEVVAKKSTTSKSAKSRKTASRKSSKKSANLETANQESVTLSDTTDVSTNFANPAISASSVADSANDYIIVRDTVVDTVYVVMPDTAASKQTSKCYNIPLPHQAAFLGHGISVGVGAGLFNASKDCDCLGVWQGQLEYHYRDYITGGFDVRFFGGTLDRDMMLMYQRYRLNIKFHKTFSGADFYAGAMLGLETTDLSEFRKELKDGVYRDRSINVDSSKVAESDSLSGDSESSENLIAEKNCEKMFSLDGFTLGVEVGLGVALSRYFGITGSASYEFNFSWAQLVAFSPGIAFDVQEIWPWGQKNLRSTWVSFEMIFQRYFNRGVGEWAVAGFVGLQFGI
jgi:hypothetical protein